ncbi:unnamed protein product [Rotaria magnacalcarata]|uniref:Vomeronasal type-1 receptor n=2 Tax=Rotaria magnacalcarata TaxID=392030 RepID=A0A816URX5_9BILA|nr:unnamed protein product [Rotaria magnacalcarata]
MILSRALGIDCALSFIRILIIYRHSRSMTTLLGFNFAIVDSIVIVVFVCQLIYRLTTDGNDKLCVFRGFLLHSSCGLLYRSFCVQALYRLSATIRERRQYLQSECTITCIILVQWLVSLDFALSLRLDGRIEFQTVYRICQVLMHELNLHKSYILMISKAIQCAVIHQNIFERQRQKHDFRIFHNLILLIISLVVMHFPSIIFFLITQFSHVTLPMYAQSICYVTTSLGHGFSMLLCLFHNDDIRKCLKKTIRKNRGRFLCVRFILNPIQITPIRT